MRRRFPRAVNLLAQAAVFPALFVGAPVSLSQRGRRHGWSAGRPGPVNLVGAVPLGAGAALWLWAMSSHYRAARGEWEIRPGDDYLLTRGPYWFSRNPMYVGEAAMWAGWAVLFGSLPVTAGLLAVTAVQNVAVRREERTLRERWAPYDDYRAQVPRWLRLPAVSRSSKSPQGKPSVSNSADDAVTPDIGPIAPPFVNLLGRGPTRMSDVIATTSVGKPVSLTAQVTAHAWNRVELGILTVATPGTIAGGFEPESAMNPARHLAESEPLQDLTAGTAEVSVSFQASEPGAYPVFYLDEFIQAAGRRLPPRTDSGGRVRHGCAPLGDIVVK